MNKASQTLTIAMLAIEENIRKKILYILLFFSFLLIAFSASFTSFELGTQLPVMKDISMSGISLFGIVFTLSLFLNVIPQEIERKTIYPIITQPITRGTYLAGKYLGIMALIAANLLILGIELMIVLFIYGDGWNWMVLQSIALNILQCGVLGALMMAFSLIASYPLALSTVIFLYIVGGISTPYINYLSGRLPDAMIKGVIFIKYLLPKFDCFNIKDAIVHSHTLPAGYFTWCCVYGITYIALVMLLASILFDRKDL